jgi:hypothetical protein
VPLQYLGLILLGILLFGILNIYKQVQKSARISQDILVHKQRERQQLLYEIAHLDDQYARGMIEERFYSLERTRRKQQLIELTTQCKTIL